MIPQASTPSAIIMVVLTSSSLLASSQERTLILSDDFQSAQEFEKNWSVTSGHARPWSIDDEVLVIKQTNPKHGAVVRREHKFGDIDLEIDFRFSGGKSFNFVFDDKNEKSVHASHICRVSVWPTRLSMSDDKTGSMNLEVRAKRKNDKLPPKETEALDKLLDETRSSVPIKTEPDQWHTLRVIIQGDLMKAFIDGEPATELKSPGFAHPTKTKFGMTVNGDSIDFDKLRIHSNGN